MVAYVLKRLLLFLPTLLAVSMLAFGLNKCAPGDPVVQFMTLDENSRTGADYQRYQQVYAAAAARLGLDKPAFYLQFTTAAYPDTLYRVLQADHRANLDRLLARYGCWPEIQAYYRALKRADLALVHTGLRSDAAIATRTALLQLYVQHEPGAIGARLDTIALALKRDGALAAAWQPAYAAAEEAYRAVETGATPWKHYLPALYWHGSDNQYHHWLGGVLRGYWGVSYRDERPVFEKIKDAARWTLLLNLPAIALAYLLAIPIGVYSAVRPGGRFDRWSNFVLLTLYSLPGFWVAILLTVFFTNPQYGMDWFPSLGVGEPGRDDSWLDVLQLRAAHLFLPVVALTYGSLAFIARQVRGSMTKALGEDFVRTARAKGLPERAVIWRHAFRNALFPLITLFSGILPAALAGSVVVEAIFNIPGMGLLTIESILNKDWPVVYAVLMMTALLTVAGILLADLLYAWADPRVRLS
jgi:peptide/nickel transport system permease protein